MIRHVIFDLDGTLVDSCLVCVDIFADMLRDRGSDHVIDPVVARRHMSRGGAGMVAALLGPHCTDAAQDLTDFRTRYYVRSTPVETLFPGVAESLARLSAAGIGLAICSNKPQALCEKVLADTGLSGHFDVVVGGGPGLRPKPFPDLLDTVLAKLGARVGECLFVGDSELDHAVAEQAAMPFHFVTYGYASENWRPATSDSFGCFTSLTDSILARVAMIHA